MKSRFTTYLCINTTPHLFRGKHMSAIDDILWLLKDGEWYHLKEIAEKTAVPEVKVEIAISFLGEYNFVQLNKKIRRVRLQPAIIKFIDKIQHIEKEEVNSLGL